jgi:hypothetical protein
MTETLPRLFLSMSEYPMRQNNVKIRHCHSLKIRLNGSLSRYIFNIGRAESWMCLPRNGEIQGPGDIQDTKTHTTGDTAAEGKQNNPHLPGVERSNARNFNAHDFFFAIKNNSFASTGKKVTKWKITAVVDVMALLIGPNGCSCRVPFGGAFTA